MDWTELAQGEYKCCALANIVVTLWVQKNVVNVLSEELVACEEEVCFVECQCL